MNILIVSTTTHKQKSTSKLVLNAVGKLASSMGHEIWYIDANELHIVSNLSCYSDGGKNCASKEAGEYRCWAHKLSHENPKEYGGKDEMGQIYDALDWADVVVWGTSVRWGSHSALMQKIIERMNTLENRHTVYGEDNPLEGKKCGVIVTGQHYKAPEVADHLITQFGWFGFKTHQANSFSWQKTQDIHEEQEGDNRPSLLDYLKTDEGGKHLLRFLSELLD
jgi:multimeric flavodoxin WrbA